MSLWWVRKEQLDPDQVALIESLPLKGSYLVVGPPGSGKTNVLLRRAQFVRSQNMPRVLVLSFTRALTEFVKTGCYDTQGREVFPESLVNTIESWLRGLITKAGEELPDEPTSGGLIAWKRVLAERALELCRRRRVPKYDALFVDEAQDLIAEEVALLLEWSDNLFFVGDDRQKLYGHAEGLAAVRGMIPGLVTKKLRFHYRIVKKICRAADRILVTEGGESLERTSQYNGPQPGEIAYRPAGEPRETQVAAVAAALREQVRVYADLIRAGDRIGVVTARRAARDDLLELLESDPELSGKCQIIRARDEGERGYDPSFDAETPICLLTTKGCKGLEFRALHWLFADEDAWMHKDEDYYTVVTRAKTSLAVYYRDKVPEVLVRAHAESGGDLW